MGPILYDNDKCGGERFLFVQPAQDFGLVVHHREVAGSERGEVCKGGRRRRVEIAEESRCCAFGPKKVEYARIVCC